jgi:transcriptional regulator GlxA family with amidase domain
MNSAPAVTARIADRRRIGILLFDGVTTLDFVGPAEVFHEANSRTGDYDLVFLSADGAPIVTSMGLRIAVDAAAADSGRLDTLIVPGGESAPDVYGGAAFGAVLAGLVDRSRRVASVCSGAFALAALGVLDGHDPLEVRRASRCRVSARPSRARFDLRTQR